VTIVFTICSNNYLAQAIVLGKSINRYNPGYSFIIGLVDKRTKSINYDTIPFEIIEVESIGLGSFTEMALKYDITELNTAVKPGFFNFIFEKYPEDETVIYLDPDILIYNSFTTLEEELKHSDIIVIPHFTTPIEDDKFQQEENFLNSGLYNLGFIAIKKSEEGSKMVSWWAKRLMNKAYINFEKGLFTDQIWINFIPLFFKNVKIFHDKGYNVAYWNLHERYLINRNEIIFGDQIYPLVFYHFSGFDPLKPQILSKYQNRFSFSTREDILPIYSEYSDLLFAHDYMTFIQYPCYYVTEKQQRKAKEYLAFKKSIPLYKRVLRGVILRLVKFFKIDTDYYLN
jgi:hypothetical protein